MLRTCEICSSPLPADASTKVKYCSERCIRVSRQRHPYSKARNSGRSSAQRIASYAIQEQGRACVFCGWSIPDHDSYGVEIHHITPIAEGGTHDRENLAVLCPNHHKLADLNRISDEELKRVRQEAAQRNVGFDPVWQRLRPAIERLDAQRAQLRAELAASPKHRPGMKSF